MSATSFNEGELGCSYLAKLNKFLLRTMPSRYRLCFYEPTMEDNMAEREEAHRNRPFFVGAPNILDLTIPQTEVTLVIFQSYCAGAVDLLKAIAAVFISQN